MSVVKKLLVFLIAAAPLTAAAQTFIPMREGVVLEYKYYDTKGKPLRDEWRNERFLNLTVEEVWGDSIVNVGIENETFRRFEHNRIMKPIVEQLAYGDVRVTGDEVVLDNILWAWNWLPEDMRNIPDEVGDEMPDIKIDVKLSGASHLPKQMNKGDKLPDERYTATFGELPEAEEIARREEEFDADEIYSGLPKFEQRYVWEMRVVATNRHVEGTERIKTSAREWDCLKISYMLVGPSEHELGIPTIRHTINIETGKEEVFIVDPEPPVMFKYIDYLSPEVGLVKREKMNFRGNRVEETMVLTAITE